MATNSTLVLIGILAGTTVASAQKVERREHSPGRISAEITRNSDGEQHGITKLFSRAGKLQRQITYSHNEKDGAETEYDDAGHKSKVTTWERDAIAHQTTYFSSGRVEEDASYSGGELHGKWQKYYESGKLSEVANYKNGYLNGDYTQYSQEGKIWTKKSYKTGALEGVSIENYGNGKIKSNLGYKENKLEGVGKFYFESGNLRAEVRYSQNDRTGEMKEWYRSGELLAKSMWKSGELQSIEIFNKAGKVMDSRNTEDEVGISIP